MRKALIVAVAAGLVALGGWFAWRWYTTPVPPAIPLETLGEDLREPLQAALERVRRQPRSADAWGELSLVLTANQMNEFALRCLSQTERLDPSDPRWPYFRGLILTIANHREAAAALRLALARADAPEQRAAILYRLALALIEDDRLDEAAERLEALRSLESDSLGLRYGLALLASARGDRETARELLSTFVEHPNFRKKACSLLAMLTAGEVAATYRQRAAKLPDDVPWITSLETQLQPYKVQAAGRLAPFYKLGREGHHAEAVAYLRELAADAPDEQVCFALGYTLLTMNQPEDAERHLRQALTFNPNHVKANLYLGAALFIQGEQKHRQSGGKDQAADLFRQVVSIQERTLKLRGDLAQANMYRGLALKFLGQKEESLRSLRAAVAAAPDSAEAHLALGEALAEFGHRHEGLQHLQNAASFADPKDERPRRALEKWRLAKTVK